MRDSGRVRTSRAFLDPVAAADSRKSERRQLPGKSGGSAEWRWLLWQSFGVEGLSRRRGQTVPTGAARRDFAGTTSITDSLSQHDAGFFMRGSTQDWHGKGGESRLCDVDVSHFDSPANGKGRDGNVDLATVSLMVGSVVMMVWDVALG